MSKAFTREPDDSDAAEPEPEPDPEAMPRVRNLITPAGLAGLNEERHRLLHVDRPKVVETVSWAAGNGDRSENGDYI